MPLRLVVGGLFAILAATAVVLSLVYVEWGVTADSENPMGVLEAMFAIVFVSVLVGVALIFGVAAGIVARHSLRQARPVAVLVLGASLLGSAYLAFSLSAGEYLDVRPTEQERRDLDIGLGDTAEYERYEDLRSNAVHPVLVWIGVALAFTVPLALVAVSPLDDEPAF